MRQVKQPYKAVLLLTCLLCATLMQGQTTRNILLELGYNQEAIDQRIDAVYKQLFESTDRIYFEVGDSMAYVSDLKNKDVRSEGLSYGLMVAVQLNKQEVFDKIWRWTQTYVRHHEGPRKGYFAWSFNPTSMKRNAQGSASDGELYFITTLLYAGNRWGNEGPINYYGEARQILDAMWEKDGTDGVWCTTCSILTTNKSPSCRIVRVTIGRIHPTTFLLSWIIGQNRLRTVTRPFTALVPIRPEPFSNGPVIP